MQFEGFDLISGHGICIGNRMNLLVHFGIYEHE